MTRKPEHHLYNIFNITWKELNELFELKRGRITTCTHEWKTSAVSPAVWYCPTCGHLELKGD